MQTTAEQISAYQQLGVVRFLQFFDEDEVETIRLNLNRYMDTVVPQVPPMDVFYQTKGDLSTIKMLPRMDHHDDFFRSLIHQGKLRQIAESIWACRAVPRDVAFFNKPPAIGEPTPPHQDGYYFHLTPCEAMTMWLALETVDEENGCVRYIPGSNRLGMRPHDRTQVLGFSQGISDFDEADSEKEIAFCAEPGDVIVHDAMTIHRAEGNNSPNRSRQALGFVFYSERAQEDKAASARYQQQLATEWKTEGKI